MLLLERGTQQAAPVYQRAICMALPGHRYACPWAEPTNTPPLKASEWGLLFIVITHIPCDMEHRIFDLARNRPVHCIGQLRTEALQVQQSDVRAVDYLLSSDRIACMLKLKH